MVEPAVKVNKVEERDVPGSGGIGNFGACPVWHITLYICTYICDIYIYIYIYTHKLNVYNINI